MKITGVEILIRASSEELSDITPDQYIPVAEEYSIIQQIDLWVIESTFAIIQEYFKNSNLVFSINISALELRNDEFVKHLEKLVRQYKIDTSKIELEITETSLVEADELALTVLNDLKKAGFNLALDDFGTGYTAFNQLIQYPVDCLKVDKSFVANIDTADKSKLTMVNAIISIAKSYKLRTIGEGVENKDQLDYLRSISCDYVQGFYLCKPTELDEFLVLFNEQ